MVVKEAEKLFVEYVLSGAASGVASIVIMAHRRFLIRWLPSLSLSSSNQHANEEVARLLYCSAKAKVSASVKSGIPFPLRHIAEPTTFCQRYPTPPAPYPPEQPGVPAEEAARRV